MDPLEESARDYNARVAGWFVACIVTHASFLVLGALIAAGSMAAFGTIGFVVFIAGLTLLVFGGWLQDRLFGDAAIVAKSLEARLTELALMVRRRRFQPSSESIRDGILLLTHILILAAEIWLTGKAIEIA